MLGLCFILLLERGPGREHITIQSYMLAMVAGLGALYALILAAAPVRDFFDLELLSAGQWFLCLLSAAAGLVVAALAWRLPYIQRLEAPEVAGRADDAGRPPHQPRPADTPAEPRRPVAPTGITRRSAPPHEDRRHDRAGHALGRDAWRS